MQAIATAAARLAVYDADRALELLDSLPSQGGQQEDARTMAARLVFARLHAASRRGGSTDTAGTWAAMGRSMEAFPIARARWCWAGCDRTRTRRSISSVRCLDFERGQEGLFGVCDFAGLLERAVAMEAISEDSAEEAGHNIVVQLRKLATGANQDAKNQDAEIQDAWTVEQKAQVVSALYNVRVSAPKAYAEAEKNAPGLLALRVEKVAVKVDIPKVDVGLQSAFHELADAMRERRGPEEMHAVIAQDLQLVNARYKAGGCAGCSSPDAQSWALVSLAAYATPMTIATQLNGIQTRSGVRTFWRSRHSRWESQPGSPIRRREGWSLRKKRRSRS